VDAQILPCGALPCPTDFSGPYLSPPIPRCTASAPARMVQAKYSDPLELIPGRQGILSLSANIERWCLTTGCSGVSAAWSAAEPEH